MATVCTLGFHDPNGTRYWALSGGLRAHGIDVAACHTAKAGFLPKMADLWRQARNTRCDAILVTFPGQYLMPLAWTLGKTKGVPVVLDAFISLHDTMVTDRAKVKAGSAKARFLKMVDRVSCMLADRVLLDTPEHAAFFADAFGVPRAKIIVVPVGYRSDMLRPTPLPARAPGDAMRAYFYGTFIPLQGVDTILRAMKILQDRGLPVTLDLGGGGQTAPAMHALAAELGLRNVAFLGTTPMRDVVDAHAAAHCVLGIFGVTPKTQRVIPHKAYDALGAGRPLVTADTPAARGVLRDGVDAVLVPAGDHVALAKAMERLLGDPALCASLAANAAAVGARFTPEHVVEPLAAWLKNAAAGPE